ncbi:tRNA modification GTPase GTPBP3 [Abortiporus biennis]|nr:tRNA modification GTPase GTPBP3 [Abortiporus biennis]
MRLRCFEKFEIEDCALPRDLSGLSLTLGHERSGTSPLVPSDAQRKTIYALSTPPGKAGVAVIRISGPDVLDVWNRMVKVTHAKQSRNCNPDPWRMYRCNVRHPDNKQVLDDGLAVYFKAPRSFTSEDVMELHIHSGQAVIAAVLNALSLLSQCRLAEPGEFTRRAFAAGSLDLTQVEGLKDLINSETESQRVVALSAMSGNLRNWLEQLRKDITSCLSLVEALIDFSEDDVEEGVHDEARTRARRIVASIETQLSNFHRGEILRSGVKLAIFGPPNAGKSSLFNVLAQREAAIVTSIPGTTRDVLELSLDIGGLPVIVADTAGLRHTEDVVEKIGIERATEKITNADVALCILPIPDVYDGRDISMPPELSSMISRNDTYFLFNKSDLLQSSSVKNLEISVPSLNASGVWIVSLTTGAGISKFLKEFGHALQQRYGLLKEQQGGSEPLITHARHRVHLENARRFLEAFIDEDDVVLAAEELRYAAQDIGKITGRIDVEDVLDVIFRDFCIGK